MEKAVNELKGTISERFPQASFVVEEGFDPKGIYLESVRKVYAAFRGVLL
jgi:hypothetical protein